MNLLAETIAEWGESPFAHLAPIDPWALTTNAPAIVTGLLAALDGGYARSGDVAIHRTAEVEGGALLKGPVIVGPKGFIASGSLLRGGCWIGAACAIGPGVELKSSFIFSRSRLAHFNFVGDSVLGAEVNVEAGAVIANYRNELADPTIVIDRDGERIDTQAIRFGALVGDGVRIGANAVIAPGAILKPGTVVERLSLVDQSPRLRRD